MNWLADILESWSHRIRHIPEAGRVEVPQIPMVARKMVMTSLKYQTGFQWITANLHNLVQAKQRSRATIQFTDYKAGLDGLIAMNADLVRLEEAIFQLNSIERLIRRADAMPDATPEQPKESP